MSKQFSLVGGVGSGAGALAVGTAVDQTGNLLNILATVHTPNVMVGESVTNFRGRKKRFGGTTATSGTVFDYPELAVKNPQGNGQSYRATKGGYLPGNNGGGNAGYGCDRDVDLQTKVSEDLTNAYRRADIIADMYAPEHIRTVNREYESLREHFEEQSQEYEKQKIAHLMAMGFSEPEIMRKVEKEREKAIEQAAKMGVESSHRLESVLSKMAPTTDIGLSVAPGLMPNRINADSYQRAVGAGTVVTKGKAAEAMRRREAMALKLDVEKPFIKTPMKHSEIVRAMFEAAGKEEHKRQEASLVKAEAVIKHQKANEQARVARHFAIENAMTKK